MHYISWSSCFSWLNSHQFKIICPICKFIVCLKLHFLNVFFKICLYAHCQDVEKYKLGDPRTFHYLNQSNCYELDGVNDSKEYLATRRAMNVVGISSVEQVFFFFFSCYYLSLLTIFYSLLHENLYQFPFQDAIFRVVAAVLHLGNIEFAKGQEIDSSEPKDDKSRFHLRMAAELFMFVIIFFYFFRILITWCDEFWCSEK